MFALHCAHFDAFIWKYLVITTEQPSCGPQLRIWCVRVQKCLSSKIIRFAFKCYCGLCASTCQKSVLKWKMFGFLRFIRMILLGTAWANSLKMGLSSESFLGNSFANYSSFLYVKVWHLLCFNDKHLFPPAVLAQSRSRKWTFLPFLYRWWKKTASQLKQPEALFIKTKVDMWASLHFL